MKALPGARKMKEMKNGKKERTMTDSFALPPKSISRPPMPHGNMANHQTHAHNWPSSNSNTECIQNTWTSLGQTIK